MTRLGTGWTVADVMVEDVVTVRPETPFKTMIEQLVLRGVSGLPVVDAGGRLVGIVSEADLTLKEEHPIATEAMQLTRHLARVSAREGVGEGGRVAELVARSVGRTAADVMSAPAVAIAPEASVTQAAAMMHRRGLKRLPVIDRQGRLVGIVSRSDLLKVFLRSDETMLWDAQDVLRRVLVDPEAVSVSAVDGIVTLEGDVASHEEAEAVVRQVEALPGVVGVEDLLRRNL